MRRDMIELLLFPEKAGEPLDRSETKTEGRNTCHTCHPTWTKTRHHPTRTTTLVARGKYTFEFLQVPVHPMVERLPMTAVAAVASFAACCTTSFAFMMTPPGPGFSPSPKVHLGTSGGTKFVQPDQRCVVCRWLCACCEFTAAPQRSVPLVESCARAPASCGPPYRNINAQM